MRIDEIIDPLSSYRIFNEYHLEHEGHFMCLRWYFFYMQLIYISGINRSTVRTFFGDINFGLRMFGIDLQK